MAITVEVKNGKLYIRDGEKLIQLNAESIGQQIKLTAQNGVTHDDVQAELEAIHTKISGLLRSVDVFIYKGVVNAEGDLPTTYEPGWTWKVASAGTYKGKACEIGDMIIAVVSRAGSGNENSDFDVIQANIDGAVTGPVSSADGNLAAFDGASGKVVKDSGLKMADVQAAVDDGKKVWVKTAASVPDAMPEDLHDGGLLFVDASLGG